MHELEYLCVLADFKKRVILHLCSQKKTVIFVCVKQVALIGRLTEFTRLGQYGIFVCCGRWG